MTTLNRIKHSQAGFVRRMQMSSHRLWVIVEGLIDRSFYSKICEINESTKRISYRIALPRELPDFTNDGKEAILSMYQYLHSNNLLTSNLKGQKTSVLFFLDKDVDDLIRRKIKSKYITYTEYYSAENYLYRFGNLCTALSSWALLDIRSVKSRIGEDSIRWTQNAAASWRGWVEHCILIMTQGIEGVPNYRLASMIHDSPYGNVNTIKQNELNMLIMRKSGLDRIALRSIQNKVAALVEKIYRKEMHDKVFNGKWYKKFLAEDARCAANGRQYYQGSKEEQLAQYLLLTLDYSSGWADRFHHALDQAVLRLQ